MDGLVSVWMNSAIKPFRQPFDDAIGQAVARQAAYLVTESQPIRNTRFPARLGERTEGFAQLAILKRPPSADTGSLAGYLAQPPHPGSDRLSRLQRMAAYNH